jgi:pimeloyl-ACP methyl ester carboxylesterase
LIPGFWFSGSSWDLVIDALTERGLVAESIDLPGRGPRVENRGAISLSEQIDAVVAWLDSDVEPAVLVGHSAGGNIAYGAADRRPNIIHHLILVDSVPPANGQVVNTELPERDGLIDFPGLNFFSESEVAGVVGEAAAQLALAVHPESARCAREPLALANPARLAIAATIIACGFTAEQYFEWSADDDEIVEDISVIELSTGHWPQFSRPRDLARCIADALITLP